MKGCRNNPVLPGNLTYMQIPCIARHREIAMDVFYNGLEYTWLFMQIMIYIMDLFQNYANQSSYEIR